MTQQAYIGPIVLLVVWSVASGLNLVDAFFLPSPWTTLNEFWRLFYEKIIFVDLFATLYRICISFSLVTVVGIPLGMILGASEKTYKRVEFLIEFFRSTPALSLFPLFLIIFGIGDSSKIAVATFTAGMVVVFSVAHGVLHTRKTRRLAAEIMGASKPQVFRYIMMWESLPHIFSGLRIALSWISAVIIATEMFVGSSGGLGHKMIDFQTSYNLSGLYAVILLTGIVGYLLNMILVLIEKRFLHWSTR